MASNQRVILGSETNDDRKVELDELGIKITVPVSLYDTNGSQIIPLADNGIVNVNVQDGSGTDITSTSGALDVNIASGTTLDITGDSTDLDSGAGTDDHEVFAIGLPASGGHVVGGTSTNPLRIDPIGTTSQPITDAGGSLTVDATNLDIRDLTSASDSMAAVQSGTWNIGTLTSITNDVNIADGGNSLTVDASQLDIDDLNITDDAVSAVVGANASAAGCDTIFDSSANNTAQAIKANSGRLYGIEISNPNTTDAYLQIFDLTTGNVTVGTTTPKLSFLVPAGNGTRDGAMDKSFIIPITFSTAITYACTTTATGSGNPSTALVVNFIYV